jgi:hypothetical protein
MVQKLPFARTPANRCPAFPGNSAFGNHSQSHDDGRPRTCQAASSGRRAAGRNRKYKQKVARQGRRLPSFLSLRLEVSLVLGIWSSVLPSRLPK